MAFSATNLTLLAYGNGNALWFYKTTDTAAVVDTAAYFNNAAKQLNVGDVILAYVDTDGTPGHGIFAVNANDGTTVDVADMVNLASADTD